MITHSFFETIKDTDRTLMAAQTTLASLFPPTAQQQWNENINWLPTPIHTVPQTQDSLLAGKKQCDRYDYEMIEYQKTDAYKDLFRKYKSLINYLEDKSGKELPTMNEISLLRDGFLTEDAKGYW